MDIQKVERIERIGRNLFYYERGDSHPYALCSCPNEEIAEFIKLTVEVQINVLRN